MDDLLRDDQPRWEPDNCPGHEPTAEGLAVLRAGGHARCVYCGIWLAPPQSSSGEGSGTTRTM